MNPAAAPSSQSTRLVELDALRGIAATIVMLYHFTTRYDQIFGHVSPPAFALPWGHYGVNLFFIISGFVIFMTLHRIKRPMDFVVSRFSRLFPAFWVAVALTFLLSHVLGLPEKTVSLGTAILNLFMIHHLFGIRHVDGVYWTLEIELFFYAGAMAMYLAGRLDKVHAPLLALLALRLTYFLAERYFAVDLSWTVSHLLILPYIAWFICGIMIYRLTQIPDDAPKLDVFVLIAAIVLLGIVEGAGIGLLAAALSAIIWAAAKGKLPVLANPVLAWLGAISYTLYLLHENIGWAVIMQAEKAGIATNLSIVLAIGLLLAMATAVTQLVERPAMAWIRRTYRLREAAIGSRQVTASAATIAIVFAALVHFWHKTNPPAHSAGNLVAQIFRPSSLDAVPCRFDSKPRPLMILALGQSNAGNHAATQPPPAQKSPTDFFFEGLCYRTAGPAPGGTGHGGNLWTILAPRLSQATGRPVVFSVLAVDATRVRDWAEPGVLRQRLLDTLASQRRHGFQPDLVLWQQGEADAKADVSGQSYLTSFLQLVATIRDHGVGAPIVAALSTRCGNSSSDDVRAALAEAANRDPTIRLGPDTDALTGSLRADGCHFSTSGLDAAAELWTAAILARR